MPPRPDWLTPAMSEYHETAWSVWGEKKERRMKLPDREVGNKNTRAGKIESRKMKSRQCTEGVEGG